MTEWVRYENARPTEAGWHEIRWEGDGLGIVWIWPEADDLPCWGFGPSDDPESLAIEIPEALRHTIEWRRAEAP